MAFFVCLCYHSLSAARRLRCHGLIATARAAANAHEPPQVVPGPISVEEVVRRACARAEMPRSFVRIIAQDSGNNVNAGWYLVGASAFGAHFLRYLTEV